MRIKPNEIEPLREMLHFLRESNTHIRTFWTSWERFQDLWHNIQVPAGTGKLRVRARRTARTRAAVEQTLGETLGDEEVALVIIDPKEMPRVWAQVWAAENIGECMPRPDGGSPAGTGEEGKAAPQADPRTAASARAVQETSYVTLGDPHLDAKLFPHLHPYGSGSLRAEEGAGGLQKYTKSRLTSLDRGFRDCTAWQFFNLDRLIKNDLYFRERGRRQRAPAGRGNAGAEAGEEAPGHGRKRGRGETDNDDGGPGQPQDRGGDKNAADAARENESEKIPQSLFGFAEPSHVPESRGWWDRERKNLYAITEDHEKGMMTGMVTLTQNDRAPELLAHCRRGPCAQPTEREKFEYLLARKEKGVGRPEVQKDPTAAVLSFQRRNLEMKTNFLRANRVTPLGISEDTFDRAEAQNRGALHSHILWWAKRRRLPDGYIRMPPVPTPDPGDGEEESGLPPPRPRPAEKDRKEDHPYYVAEVARVNAELVRPALDWDAPPDRVRKQLCWAFLLRTIQTRFYLHSCTMRYCLHNRTTCRFHFPWPEQMEQQFDEGTERVAYRRRYAADDQYVVPHNLYLAAFPPATANVVLLDPDAGADTARQYATKYVAKPEKYSFLEAEAGDEANPMKRYLETRLVGGCMCCGRLLGFHVVRCSRPVEYVFPKFTNEPAGQWARTPEHKAKNPGYPDPDHFLGPTQRYFFRAPELRHMRIGQVIRYFTPAARGGGDGVGESARDTGEDTCNQDRFRPRDVEDADTSHRHYDAAAAAMRPGTWVQGKEYGFARLTRRRDTGLGVPRSGDFVPIGGNREPYYEKRLLEGLAWHCKTGPEVVSGAGRRARKRWRFHCALPPGCVLPDAEQAALEFSMVDREIEGKAGFEVFCRDIERAFAEAELVCQCCAGAFGADDVCGACTHAVGFHECEFEAASSSDGEDGAGAMPRPEQRWKAGTLHGGKLDITAALLNLAKRHVPLEELERFLESAVEEGHLRREEVDEYREMFERIAGVVREVDVFQPAGAGAEGGTGNRPMTMDELRADLARREALLQAPPPNAGPEERERETDQWRLYREITAALAENAKPVRTVIQASAGTGKSFLLEAIYLWCVVHGHVPQACAPTGIAAARIHVPRTPVRAYTLHYLFGFRGEQGSAIDLSKPNDENTQRLQAVTVLLQDEFSMADDEIWRQELQLLAPLAAMADDEDEPAPPPQEPENPGHGPVPAPAPSPGEGAGGERTGSAPPPPGRAPRRRHPRADTVGRAHMLIFTDFKQLPPATGRPPFIAGDPEIVRRFEFRVLRQNRRVAPAKEGDTAKQSELDEFHEVLDDIAHGRTSTRVRKFLVAACVRGAAKQLSSARRVALDGPTAVFSKRAYRNLWNRRVLKRVAMRGGRRLKVKARFKAKGSRAGWYRSKQNLAKITRKVRSQCLPNLVLAGQWARDPPWPGEERPHMMRVMLVANVDPANRFANGATGRLLSWEPSAGRTQKPIPANDDRICARFCHEASVQQRVRLPGVDWVDVTARMESAPHEATMVQLPIGPAYGLVLHKVQSLTMPGQVLGCLEGIFAHGQVYVLVSRVTDPQNFSLIGLPPEDMLDEVAEAWRAHGYDVDACFTTAAAVTEDWEYTPAGNPQVATRNVRSRLTKQMDEERRVPVRLRTLAEILDPQPGTAEVLHRLLDWIDRADRAAQDREPKPAFSTAAGDPIFPEDGEEWWLTDFDRRKKRAAPEEPSSSEPETESSPAGSENNDEEDDDDDESDEEYQTGGDADAGAAAEGDGVRGRAEKGAGEPDRQGAAPAGDRKTRPGDTGPGAPTRMRSAGSGLGLRNLGNACYMNAVVQASMACGTAGRAVAEETPPQATELRRATRDLLRVLLRSQSAAPAGSGTRPTFSPWDFWRAVRNACPAFNNARQHDAADFHLGWRRELARLPSAAEPSPAWAAWLAETEMQVVTYMSCATCLTTSHNLPAAGEPPRDPERLVMATLQAGTAHSSMADAIGTGSFFGPEDIADSRCRACGRHGGVRVAKCRSLPRVLVVWLKRFGVAAGVERRIDAPVNRLGDDVDLATHLDAGITAPNGTRYRTRAVVCHHGAILAAGHYTCWVRDDDSPGEAPNAAWTHYDDSAVGRRQDSLPASAAKDAYLVFYELAPFTSGTARGTAHEAPIESDEEEATGGLGGDGPFRPSSAQAGEEREAVIGWADEPSPVPTPRWGGVIVCDEPNEEEEDAGSDDPMDTD